MELSATFSLPLRLRLRLCRELSPISLAQIENSNERDEINIFSFSRLSRGIRATTKVAANYQTNDNRAKGCNNKPFGCCLFAAV